MRPEGRQARIDSSGPEEGGGGPGESVGAHLRLRRGHERVHTYSRDALSAPLEGVVRAVRLVHARVLCRAAALRSAPKCSTSDQYPFRCIETTLNQIPAIHATI